MSSSTLELVTACVSASSVDRENRSWYYNPMTDSERLDWLDELMVPAKLNDFWLQIKVDSIREAVDLFAKAVDEEDEQDGIIKPCL